jgi:nucleoside-diphosphate-sugar epimerase
VTTVLIIGASRGIGLETLKGALKAGYRVRALARSAGNIPVNHPDLEKVAGDALDRSTVKQALAGVDVVMQTLGVAASPEIIFKPVRLFSDATRVLVTAMEETGVKRLICVTGFGTGESRNKGGFLYNVAFHLFLGRAYDDKDDTSESQKKRRRSSPATSSATSPQDKRFSAPFPRAARRAD